VRRGRHKYVSVFFRYIEPSSFDFPWHMRHPWKRSNLRCPMSSEQVPQSSYCPLTLNIRHKSGVRSGRHKNSVKEMKVGIVHCQVTESLRVWIQWSLWRVVQCHHINWILAVKACVKSWSCYLWSLTSFSLSSRQLLALGFIFSLFIQLITKILMRN